jgi:hypothetical protein
MGGIDGVSAMTVLVVFCKAYNNHVKVKLST